MNRQTRHFPHTWPALGQGRGQRARPALLGLCLALLASAVPADTYSGRVIGITNGDSLTLLDAQNQSHQIRLAAIDAPEKLQDFGQQATANLSLLALNQPAATDCRKRDRYRREICVVKVNGQDLGLEQIRAGMAWYHPPISEQTTQERADYAQAEFTAKVRRRGLWQGKNPTPPWDWRKSMRLDE